MTNSVEVLEAERDEFDGREWLTKEEAAKLTGLSVRKLERHATRQELSKQVVNRVVHYNRQEVLDLAAVEEAKRGAPIVTQSQLFKPAAKPPTAIESLASAAVEVAPIVRGELSTIRQSLEILSLGAKSGLTISEAAKLTGITQKRIRAAVEMSELAAVQDGNRLRVVRSDIDRWLQSLATAKR